MYIEIHFGSIWTNVFTKFGWIWCDYLYSISCNGIEIYCHLKLKASIKDDKILCISSRSDNDESNKWKKVNIFWAITQKRWKSPNFNSSTSIIKLKSFDFVVYGKEKCNEFCLSLPIIRKCLLCLYCGSKIADDRIVYVTMT